MHVLLQPVTYFRINPMHGRARHVAEGVSFEELKCVHIQTAMVKVSHDNITHVLL